jgi:hypothetical protein
MYELLNYDHSEIPKNLNDKVMKALCKQLDEEYRYYSEARSDLEESVWPACDTAYQCLRDLPQNEGMDWVDSSDLGETDIRDGVKFLAESIALALMPRDQTWFEPIALDPEDQPTMNKIRDYLAVMHRKADTRGQYEKHLKQVIVRGTGAITWTWRKRVRRRILGPAETLRNVAALAQEEGLPITFKDLKDERRSEITFDGPVIMPLDMNDVYIDPCGDIGTDEDMPVIVRKYISLEELKNAEDGRGNKLYRNLDGLEPRSISEIEAMNPRRFESYKLMGVNPISAISGGAKYVPVLCFHRAVRNFEGNQWVDTYFYVAYGSDKEDMRIIAAYENPSEYGSKSVFIDTYDEYLNSAYGTGAVEKSLSAWQQKNVLSALTLQAQLATVFPAYNVIQGMLLDDRRLRLAPGSINPISLKPSVGTNFMAPVPFPTGGQQLGELSQRWLGGKIMSQMGAYGAVLNDPTRSITESKTATQINTETTSGAVGRDNLLERISIRSLEPLMQATLDGAKQYAEESVVFEQPNGDGYELARLEKAEMKLAERIVVTGLHGMMNKANEIRELNEALGAMAQAMPVPGMMAHLIGPYQETLYKLLARLGVQNLDKYKGDPLELIMSDPTIQQQIMQLIEQARMEGARGGAEAALEEAQGAPPPGEEQAPMETPQSPNVAEQVM